MHLVESRKQLKLQLVPNCIFRALEARRYKWIICELVASTLPHYVYEIVLPSAPRYALQSSDNSSYQALFTLHWPVPTFRFKLGRKWQRFGETRGGIQCSKGTEGLAASLGTGLDFAVLFGKLSSLYFSSDFLRFEVELDKWPPAVIAKRVKLKGTMCPKMPIAQSEVCVRKCLSLPRRAAIFPMQSETSHQTLLSRKHFPFNASDPQVLLLSCDPEESMLSSSEMKKAKQLPEFAEKEQ